MSTDASEYTTLCKGLGGLRATCPNPNITVSIPSYDETPCLGSLVEGGWFVDLTPLADEESFVSWVLSAPMVKTGVPDGDPEKCPDPGLPMVAGLEGTFQVLAAMRVANPQYSGLDYVSPRDWAAYWADKGATVGCRVGDLLVKIDGTVREIRR